MAKLSVDEIIANHAREREALTDEEVERKWKSQQRLPFDELEARNNAMEEVRNQELRELIEKSEAQYAIHKEWAAVAGWAVGIIVVVLLYLLGDDPP